MGWPQIDWSRRLPASWGLGVLLGAVHLGTAVYQWRRGYESLWTGLALSRSTPFRVDVGGQLDLLIDGGHYYRLVTSTLLHGDLLHLGFNVVAILAIGRILEPWIGWLRYLGVFALGAVVASGGSHLTGVLQSDGASGGAYALLGLLLVVGLRLRRVLSAEDAWILGPVLWGFTILNVLLSFVLPFVDVAGHLFGLALGLLVGTRVRLAEDSGATRLGRWIWAAWLGVYGLAVIGGFGFVVGWPVLAGQAFW